MAKSIYLSSDETFSHICDICLEYDKDVEALAYCSVCKQYLCSTCKTVHTRSKASSSHPLLTGSEIPCQVKTGVNTGTQRVCHTHPRHVLQYVCRDHDVPCCDRCKHFDHRGCKRVKTLNRLAKERKTAIENQATLGQINALLEDVTRLQSTLEYDASELVVQKDEAIQKVRQRRSTINGVLDKWENGLIKEIKDCIDKETQLTKDNIEIFNEITPTIKKNVQQLKVHQLKDALNTPTEDTVLAACEARKITTKYAGLLREIQDDSHTIDIEFHLKDTFGESVNCLNDLGQLNITRKTGRRPGSAFSGREYKERVAEKVGEINVSTVTDTDIPLVSGVVLLPESTILVSDFQNWQLKLFDESFQLVSNLKMSSAPWRMAPTDTTGEIIITMFDQKSLQLVNILDGRIFLGQNIKTKKPFGAIVKYKNDFIVISCNKRLELALLVITKTGNIVKTICTKSRLREFRGSLVHMLLSADSQTLYLPYRISGCVAISVRTGDVLFTYTDDRVRDYCGITADPAGNLYITGTDSNNVILINQKGETIKMLLENVENARYIKYDSSTNTLFVHKKGTRCMDMYYLL